MLINFRKKKPCCSVFSLRPSYTACVRYSLRLAIVTFELRQLALKKAFGSSGKVLH